jgi:hypothetical protein
MRKPVRAKKGRSSLSWYLLIHQLPPEPLYLRAKIRQRLTRVGAIPLKNSVYVLPRREDCLEDFQWIAEEAIAGGGEAHICEAEFLGRATGAALIERSRAERSIEYERLARDLAAARPGENATDLLARGRTRFEEIRGIDFFSAAAGREVTSLLARLERQPPAQRPRTGGSMNRANLVGRTWATRRGVKVDRIASGWLIRRFLDAKARFRFIDPAEPPRPGELRFDMVGGDFTHEGDRCTFETLLARAKLRDAALSRVAEIVHDIDIKDGKFGRPEAAGVQQLLAGLLLAHTEDEERLTRGFELFDALYQSFRGKRALPRRRPRR